MNEKTLCKTLKIKRLRLFPLYEPLTVKMLFKMKVSKK